MYNAQRPTLLLAALAMTLPMGLPVAAQTAPAGAPANPFAGLTRFAGVIESVDNGGYKLKVSDGSTLAFRLAPDARVMLRQPAQLAALAAGKFVGCTAVKGTGTALHATECHIFPEAMRGVGEGHNPMGPPDTTMTNGNVATMTNGNVQAAGAGAASVTLAVAYKGGEQMIEANGQTEITEIVAASAAQLKAGTRVNGAARIGSEGTALVPILNIVP